MNKETDLNAQHPAGSLEAAQNENDFGVGRNSEIPDNKGSISPERNNFSFGSGRPPIYNSPEEMQFKIIEYFQIGFRTKNIIVKTGKDTFKEITVPKITITDLVLYLGFADRHSFYDYEKRDEFSHTIKRARTFIEREYEDQLSINPTGAIFALKNFGWTDKTEHEIYGPGGMPINNGNAELREISQDLKKLIPPQDDGQPPVSPQ